MGASVLSVLLRRICATGKTTRQLRHPLAGRASGPHLIGLSLVLEQNRLRRVLAAYDKCACQLLDLCSMPGAGSQDHARRSLDRQNCFQVSRLTAGLACIPYVCAKRAVSSPTGGRLPCAGQLCARGASFLSACHGFLSSSFPVYPTVGWLRRRILCATATSCSMRNGLVR